MADSTTKLTLEEQAAQAVAALDASLIALSKMEEYLK